MKQPLHVLHIEDSAEDCALIERLLSRDGMACEISRVETHRQVFDALQNDSIDIVLSDYKLPGFSGAQALEITQALRPEIPFVFVSGTIGEETAIQSLRCGATDYVLKSNLSRLAPTIRHALAEAEERMLRRQLRHRFHEVERLEAIGTLAHGIAHEFNNILTIILGHASLIDANCRQPELVLERAQTIMEAGQRGATVVEQLMAFARTSDGPTKPIDLNHFIQDKLDRLKGKLPPQVELAFVPADNLPPIMADAPKLDLMLMNLVANSVEAMPDGGTITLLTDLASGKGTPDLPPKLNSVNYVCLMVADSGKGMDTATKGHVFEPFYTTKEQGQSSGMGLPVVYGLMHAHHGYIDIASEPGEGTTISLFFPVTPTVATKAPPLTLGPDPSLRGSETILVVEDEPEVGSFLETILESYGYHVLLAHEYEEALKLFHEHYGQVELVFSDIGLPKVDGISLCAKLRTLKADLPIILASGYSPKKFQARMEDLDAGAFLAKPYHTHHILQSVRKVLDNSKVPAPSL